MALVFGDRVYETSTTTGNGTITLAGIGAANYRTFSDVIGNGNTCYYAIVHRNANEWEVGVGTVGAGSLARTTVLKTSAGNTTKIVFSAGTKDVFCDLPAEQVVALDASGNLPFTTLLFSTTALATPSALAATAFNAFASTVSGATIMGYGTTADVTLKNRAGTDVLKIGPNTTAAVFDGAVTSTGNLTVGASKLVVTAATGATVQTGTATVYVAAAASYHISKGANAQNAGYTITNAADTLHWTIYQTLGAAGQQGVLNIRDSVAGVNAVQFAVGGLLATFPGALAITGALTGVTDFTASGYLAFGGTAVTGGAGTVSIGGVTRTTIGANGAATALTANPLGYIDIYVAGTTAQIPYYNRGA